VGLARFPDDARDVESLIRQADADMYRRKRPRDPDSDFGRG
jgi:predicted signal transduction protein with EAL and GGDEF domain